MTTSSETATRPEMYYAGACWGPRKESPEECAWRVARFLDLLAGCDPFLSHWYKPTRSRRDATRHPLMPPDVLTLTEMLKKGANRERGGPAIEQLGFGLSFDNGGARRDCADLRIYCGGYSEAVSNSCFLSLPREGANAERIFTALVLKNIVRSMALAWEPDWVAAMSRRHRDADDPDGKADLWLGWVTYLARQRGTIPPLPAPVQIEPVEDKGMLIILTPERFTVASPEHIALARRVRELLTRAGLMRPVMS